MNNRKIKGVIAPSLTFFKSNGDVDLKLTGKHMKWMLDSGVNGLFVTGTYGSGYLMDSNQRKDVYKLALDVVSDCPDAYFIAHVGTNDTASSVDLAREASRLNAAAVSAVNPYTFSYSERELMEYYGELVSAAGDIPVLAYANPALTGKKMELDFLIKLNQIGVKGIKDSYADIHLGFDVCYNKILNKNDFRYIPGTTTNWLNFRELSLDTFISGACNYIPEVISTFYRISMSDDRYSAEVAYELINEAIKKIKYKNSIISSHFALKARGFDAGFAKRPLIADYEENEDLIKIIREVIEEVIEKI